MKNAFKLPLLLAAVSGMGAAPTESKIDLYGDPLPKHAVARMGTVRFLPKSLVAKLSYSANGKLLASRGGRPFGSLPGVQIWNAETGQEVGPSALRDENAYALAWGPDGRHLAVATKQGQIRIWNIDSGEVHQIANVDGSIVSLDWSRGGGWIAAAIDDDDDSHVRLWKADGQQSWVFDQPANAVALAGDGSSLAAASAERLTIWDVESGKAVSYLEGDWKKPFDVEFSPDGNSLALAGGHVYLFRKENQILEAVQLSNKETAHAYQVAFSPDGTTVAAVGMRSEFVAFWNVPEGKEMRRLKVPNAGPALTFSPDGKSIVTAHQSIHAYPLDGDPFVERWPVHTGPILRATLSGDGQRVYSGGSDNTVRVWDIGSGRHVTTIRISDGRCQFMSISRDGKLMAVPRGKSIIVVEVSTGEQVAELQGHDEEVLEVAFSPTQDRLVSTSIKKVISWDAMRYRVLRTYIWNWTEEEATRRAQLPLSRIQCSPDGKQIAIEWYGAMDMTLLDAETLRKTGSTPVSGNFLGDCMAYSPDSRHIILTAMQNIYVIDAQELQATSKIEREVNEKALTAALTMSPNGEWLAIADWIVAEDESSTSRQTIRLYDTDDGKLLAHLEGHTDMIKSLSFTPDSKQLVSASQDTTLLVWDLTAAREALEY